MTRTLSASPPLAAPAFMLSLVLLGCATGHPSPVVPTESSAAAIVTPATVRPPSVPWSSLDAAGRKQHMHEVVVPAMKALFQAYDGTRFADFGCRTCHGIDARALNYAMPAPHLPVLYPSGSNEQRATVEAHRDMARFMYQQVTPNMRTALGAPQYDATTGEGFSCFYCHPRGEPAELATAIDSR